MSSTAPVIFKRTKTKSAQRTRAVSSDNDPDTGAEAGGEESPSTLAAKLKSKVKKSKIKSRLSFGGDEDEESGGEVFQVKKSNLSKKLALGKHPANIPLDLDQANIASNRGPSYDQAYLNELKASTPSARPPLPTTDSYAGDVSGDAGDVPMQVDEDVEIFDESETIIPSESSIKAAKERRDRLKKIGGSVDEDFISLSVVRRDGKSEGPHPGSRLMREEDELGEGDDEFAEYTSAQERIALGKKSRKAEANQRRNNMKELIEDVEEGDEEEMEWEQAQVRRGGHRAADVPSPKVKQSYKPAPIPVATPVPTLGPAMSRLAQQLAQLTTSHATNTAALNTLERERNDVDNREKEMREMVEKAEEKRAWFVNFKEWVEGVAGFLDEKYPALEKLEEEHISLLKERSSMIAKRRSEDDGDDLTMFLGPSSIPPEEPMEETDDLGRVIPILTPAEKRSQRRIVRVARRELRRGLHGDLDEEDEGYSTDSSLPAHDQTAYGEAIESLSTRKKEILADVKAAEFRDPGKGRWSVWREKYADSYVGAWGGLGVVSAWEFWTRLELLGWDCIEDSRGLDTFKWYKGLYEYSRPGEGEVEERELGPDGDLVASMISTAVIPRICKIIEGGAFDVYSERHTRRLIDLAEEVESSLEGENAKVQAMIKSGTTEFQSAIVGTEKLLAKHGGSVRGPLAFDPESIPARRRFLARQVKLLRNLLRWRKYTKERFGVGMLVSRLVDVCILSVTESGWDVGGEDVARMVASVLPEDLKSPALVKALNIHGH